MNEQKENEVLVARYKALHQIALETVIGTQTILGHVVSEEIAEAYIEELIEVIAPGCGHVTRR